MRDLPEDPESGNFRRQVHEACFSRVTPTAVKRPRLLASDVEVEVGQVSCSS